MNRQITGPKTMTIAQAIDRYGTLEANASKNGTLIGSRQWMLYAFSDIKTRLTRLKNRGAEDRETCPAQIRQKLGRIEDALRPPQKRTEFYFLKKG
ncbi:MAG: hypothetical protein V1728_00075 [Candidatus Micrarchaeota archaeon]